MSPRLSLYHGAALFISVAAGTFAIPIRLDAQADTTAASRSAPAAARAPSLDSLERLTLITNPTVIAAMARVQAARAQIDPAGARPDPMLTAGIQNFPISDPGFTDVMTMKTVGISQIIPYPGKLALRTRAARDGLAAAEARLAQAKLNATRDVEDAYYDLAFTARALDIVQRNAGVLRSLIAVSQARYTAGTGTQTDILRARTEAARLSDEASRLAAQRRTALARLNALLDRPSDTPVGTAIMPRRIVRAAVADSAAEIHFTGAALGAPAADSPLLPLDSLQQLALANSPALHAHQAMIAAQTAQVELARKAARPDFDVSLSYGQRRGFGDLVSATVSVPIPLQKGRKQDAAVAEARADLAALEAEHHEVVNTLRADIAQRVNELERSRTQLALYKRAVLPQAQATLASTTASYQVGRANFTSVIDAQAELFNDETAYYRALTDFAKALADVQRLVGAEVLR